MKFTQITLKRKIIIVIVIILSLLSIVFINNSLKKLKHDRFVNAFEESMAKLMVSIDIYDVKKTLLTKENNEIMNEIEEILDDTQLSESEKDSFFYLSRKNEYQVMENIFEKTADWDNQTTFEKNRMVDHILNQQIMYEAYLGEQTD